MMTIRLDGQPVAVLESDNVNATIESDGTLVLAGIAKKPPGVHVRIAIDMETGATVLNQVGQLTPKGALS